MGDLQEIRRFWPKATCLPLSDGRLAWIPEKLCLIDLRVTKAGNYAVVRHDPKAAWDVVGFGDTIAAAMAAAGFGVRPKGTFRRKARDVWRFCKCNVCRAKHGFACRQRPRKGVRLGRRKWREWLDGLSDYCHDEARDDYASRVGADCRAHGLC